MRKAPTGGRGVLLLAALVVLGSAAAAWPFTAPRFGPTLFRQEQGLKIYAYDLPPVLDAQMPGMGVAATVVQAALEEEGIAVQVEVLPVRSLAKRALLYDDALAVVGEPGLFAGAEGKGLSSVPCYQMSGGYYYYRPSRRVPPRWEGDPGRMKGYRFGTLRGADSGGLRRAGCRVVEDELGTLFRKLKAGELDLLLLPDLVAKEYLQRRHPDQAGDYGTVEGASHTFTVAATFSGRNPQAKRVKGALSRGLRAIRANGKYGRILAIHQDPGAGTETYVPSAGSGVVEFGSNDSPPYYTATLPRDGMAGEIVHALFEELGLKAAIHYFPLKRLRTDLKNNHLGDPDNFVGQHFSAIVPVAVYRCAFFYYLPRHRNGIVYRTPQDLNGYRIGVVRGTLEDKGFFDRHAITVIEANDEEHLFRLLKEGRIDLCGMIRGAGRFVLSRRFRAEAHNFASLDIPDSLGPIAIMLDGSHPNGAALGERLDEALTRLMKNGTYQRIVEKYKGSKAPSAEYLADLERFRGRYRRQRSGEQP